MNENARIDQIQERALALPGRVGGEDHLLGLSGQILSFPHGHREITAGVGAAVPFQAVPNQPAPFAPVQTALATQLAFETQIHPVGLSESWLFNALTEIDQLLTVADENGFPAPTAKSLESARTIARTCSHFGLREPAFDIRERGDIEAFCREGARGLLILIHADDTFQVFGDFDGDQWRARYNLKGSTWKSHLADFCENSSCDDSTAKCN
jgi:hypothetical protein